jgi:oligopeptide/dipeptide ABC transporter ATP-binding protein
LSAPLVQIRNLSVSYLPASGGVVHAVDGLDLDVFKGEITGILGESGSGKSTLAAALVRLVPSSAECSGSLLFDGNNLLAASECEVRTIRGAKIALIPQDPAISLNPVIRVGDQISEVLRAHFRPTRKERKLRVEGLLAEVGFGDAERIAGSYPHQLSGGQRQRIAIAQAIACRPSLIVADEPTSKLDSQLQGQIIELLRDIVRRHATALLLITHDPTILAGFADRIVVMYAGRIVEQGPAEDILRRPLHPYAHALVGLANIQANGTRATRLLFIPGDAPDPTQIKPGCCFEPRCSDRKGLCALRDPQAFSPEFSRLVSCFKYGD